MQLFSVEKGLQYQKIRDIAGYISLSDKKRQVEFPTYKNPSAMARKNSYPIKTESGMLLHRITIFCLLLICFLRTIPAQAQVSPPPAYTTGVPVNYVRSFDATAPEQDANSLLARSVRDVKQTTQYFDGLGRPLQKVVKQGALETGNAAVDLVSPIIYDAFGREQYKYLPFAANGNASTSDGAFKTNPFQQQVAFYNTQLSGQAGETNIGSNQLNCAYSKSNFEAAALYRVTDS